MDLFFKAERSELLPRSLAWKKALISALQKPLSATRSNRHTIPHRPTSALMSYLSLDRPWRWGAIPLGAQAVWMFATQGLGNLWPLGLIMGILAVPPALTARLGPSLRRRSGRTTE
jgi:hypothetical protein